MQFCSNAIVHFLCVFLSVSAGGVVLTAAEVESQQGPGQRSAVVSRFAARRLGEEFQNLLVDADAGRAYLGATNAIYQLDTDTLSLTEQIRTGPELDSPLCNFNDDCILSGKKSTVNRTLSNNRNQVLLLHPEAKLLLVCGTIRQGVCSLHRRENVSRTVPVERPVPVAANSDNATTAAFLGPGPSGQTVLYVGATFTTDPYRDNFPAVCSRTLTERRPLQLVDPGDVTGQSGLMIRNEFRADFRVFYVGGFHSDGYAYWATVQRRTAATSDLSATPYISKLARVCSEDRRYESYGELPLECLGADNSQYNVLRAMHVGRLGSDALLTSVDANLHPVDHPDMEFLVGVFAKMADPWKPAVGQQSSAICIFSLKEIRAAFMFNLQRCNSGIGKWNLPHFGFDQKCYNITSQKQQSSDFCQPLRVGGEMPASSVALITYRDEQLTSVVAETVGRRTVLFAGTSDGKMKKIYLQTIKHGRQYDEIRLTVRAAVEPQISAPALINPDMFFDQSRRHMYAMTSNELLKIRVETCASYETCDACLGAGDPYCGWCTLENRCSTEADCPSANVEHGYLPMNDQRLSRDACPKVDTMTPTNASLYASADTTLTLEFNLLPPPLDGGVYQCIFEASTTPAEYLAPRTLRCSLPPYADRPTRNDQSDADHVTVPLKIWSSTSSAVFYETRFVFYDCGAHQLCTSCVSSRWPCDWCLTGNRCIHDADACNGAFSPTDKEQHQQVRILHDVVDDGRRMDDVFLHARRRWLAGEPSHVSLFVHGGRSATSLPANQCPHIDVHDLPEVLLPDSYPKAITVPVVNLDKLPAGVGQLECITSVEDREIRVRGWLSDDGKTVNCEEYAYSYATETRTATVGFHLRTQAGSVIDRMQVRIYKCQLIGADCSRCLSADSRYQCAWCDGKCQYRQTCPSDAPVWSSAEHAADSCPAPVITSISPSVGPVEGGTRLEIRGRDLGLRKADVDGNVLIGGTVRCDVEDYVLAERLTCITRSAEEPFESTVEVRLADRKVGRSSTTFRFVQPSLSGFHPNIGPQSGGTELLISGSHLLDAGTIKVNLGALPCHVDRFKSTSERLVCLTSAANHSRLTIDTLTVSLDNANRSLAGRFEYTPDPSINSIYPNSAFRAGGRLLVVRGKYMTSVQRPQMFYYDLLTNKPVSESTICRVINATLMICTSPPASPDSVQRLRRDTGDLQQHEQQEERDSAERPQAEQPRVEGHEQVGIAFTMDGLQLLMNKSQFGMTLVPDPIYEPFQGGVRVHRGDPLIIEGHRLNLASSEKDVRVTVGGQPCNVTFIAANQLVCQPPPKPQPSPKSAESLSEVNIDDVRADRNGDEPVVVVQVGRLQFPLGRLIYDPESLVANSGHNSGINMALVGGVVGGCAALFVIAMVAVAVWWRKKSWQAEKEYKRIQLQMDTLESNVRQECKQAFAELQTDMSDLTGDLVALGIPYHTRRSYAAKILFKEEHQAAMRMLDWQHCHGHGYSGPLHNSLVQFEQLLWNKQFVLLLTDTLERQPSFGSQDRVYVASLLTAALAKNMQYLTDLLVTLLRQLIAKAASGKFPQLMLRRTESVVEKMLANWIALCMYDYMLDTPGNSLFLMFKALKHQTEKGPVDSVTGDARYSLSEDRLLKEQIESEPILLRVIPPIVDNGPGETILCRVLSCDTISQVKSKVLDTLYRNTPHSSRPALSDIDLEWRTGTAKGSVILQDDSRIGSPASPKDGWRRLNTVQYYSVPNNAVIIVVPKPKPGCIYGSGSTHTYMSISSSTYLLSHSSSSNGSSPNAGNGVGVGVGVGVGGGVGGGGGSSSGHGTLSQSGRRSPPENCEQTASGCVRYWHMVKPEEVAGGLARNGSIPEIYLTRLLATKGTVQQFIDDFFGCALKIGPSFPSAIKFLFDLLEEEAERNGVNDPSVVYAWKNNSLPLRFWVNIIKNPDFLLDVEKTPTVDACLSVVAQTFMDACSAAEQRLGKDSPSNKLLFARDLPRYRQMFGRFYADIQRMPSVSEQELQTQMAQASKAYAHELNSGAAVRELLAYAVRYKDQVLSTLEMECGIGGNDRFRLSERFEQTLLAMGRHSVV